jgi:TolB-like protein/Tfp pilus assembly protein PilF
MASIVSGYEYDVFISYRHNDNLDGWVSDFVENLDKELKGTIKEPVSIYFDTNPHDGVLETHNVEKSLESKLKSLIFIPVLSRTYCDTKSYAWKYEFCAFKKLVEDKFGMDINLVNGNVTSRILPIKIHDIDKDDSDLLEKEMGGVVRAIDFFHKTAGVNRPLTSRDDEVRKPGKILYHDQVNKVANAIHEILRGIKNKDNASGINESLISQAKGFPSQKKMRRKIVSGTIPLNILIALALLMVTAIVLFFLIPLVRGTHLTNSITDIDRSIAVLPFKNIGNNPQEQYLSDGMKEEILNHLFKIGGLKIPSSSSTLKFTESKLSVREIARELHVSYLLEGNVRKSDNNVRIIVRLINGKNEDVVWTEDYKRSMTASDILDIQSDVALQVAANLKIMIDPDVQKRIETRPTVNTEAYTLFLQAREIQNDSYQKATQLLQNAVSLDPGFADAYAELAFARMWYMGDTLSREQILSKVEPLLFKALELDYNSIMAHSTLAEVKMWYYWDLEAVEKELQIVRQLNPSNTAILSRFYNYFWRVGKVQEGYAICKNNFEENKTTAYSWINMANAYSNIGEKEKALETIETALRLFPHKDYLIRNANRIFVELGEYDKAINLFEKDLSDVDLHDLQAEILAPVGIAYYKTGNKSKSTEILSELLSRNKNFARNEASYSAAQMYVAMGEKDMALHCLEKSYSKHELSMVYLKADPYFRLLNGDSRFENLLLKIGSK